MTNPSVHPVNTVDLIDLDDCQEALSNFYQAFYALNCLVGGCDNSSMPSPQVLWHLLEVLLRDCEAVLLALEKAKALERF